MTLINFKVDKYRDKENTLWNSRYDIIKIKILLFTISLFTLECL